MTDFTWTVPVALILAATAYAIVARSLAYRGLRAGFRRTVEGRWEWVYLVQGERP